ncbi:asparagine synthase [Sesbania bispinosa]|nr:asparagine synthase [Sesbania bispinosa]
MLVILRRALLVVMVGKSMVHLQGDGDNHVVELNKEPDTGRDKREPINDLSPFCLENMLQGSSGRRESTQLVMGGGQSGPLVVWNPSGPHIQAVGSGLEAESIVRYAGSTNGLALGPIHQPSCGPIQTNIASAGTNHVPSFAWSVGPHAEVSANQLHFNNIEQELIFGRAEFGPYAIDEVGPFVDRCQDEPIGCDVGPLAGRVDMGSDCDDVVCSTIYTENNPSKSVLIGYLQEEMDARDCIGAVGLGQGCDYSLADLELFVVPIVSVEDVQELGAFYDRLNGAQREVVPKKKARKAKKKGS